MQEVWKEIDTNAKRWIREAGERLMASLQKTLTIETKSSAADLVTNMDREIEQFLIGEIKQTFPNHYILGEEGYGDEVASSEGVVWLIDPIDGTMNFVHQKRNFAISIGIYENGIGRIGLIYDPVHDELYHAVKGEGAFCNGVSIPSLEESAIENGIIALNATWLTDNPLLNMEKMMQLVKLARGTRSYGCAALEMVYVATGRLDAYVTPRLSPWDFGGGMIIVEEVGGKVTTFAGTVLSIVEKSSVLVAKPGVYEELLPYVSQ
ncbi:inositol monophosphatase family protein [Bacillus sp. Xin]|uniref:inositol monophosphatase family protein n=1 Tax=unclassified Bacillus (in: firmicutes) TaxID=185979 RepID=UPI00157212DF|nr:MULTISPECIES: inositol monophosphatase family protein [unclassified Bacillus (in: firmicutes)]MBC6974168.1 inositol monophosphatase family protein [Bacillus sp. Xin]NSW35046.1 inositol monophosphatase family protein [Bacillus sp. Xin1]